MAFRPQSARPSPKPTSGAAVWLRENVFNGVANSVLSVVSVAVIAFAIFNLLSWLITQSDWQVIWNNQRLLTVFRYPSDLLWRPMFAVIAVMTLFGVSAGVSNEGTGKIIRGAFYWIAGLVSVIALIALLYWESVRFYWLLAAVLGIAGFFLGQAMPQLGKRLSWAWVAIWFVCTFLLRGFGSAEGSSMFRIVDYQLWGGTLLTFFLSITGIVVSFPLGIALALGRESKLPAVKWVCTTYIEVIRGAPLITWLFMASILLPLMIGTTPAGIVRAQVAIILFAAAYMAENVRGGLQALPKGQSEAAHALGLTPWDTTRIIILPQALRAVIPAIVGLFIGLFKDTSLVLLVGLVDLFNAIVIISTGPDATQVSGGILRELFIYGAVLYWFFCYRMSVASRQLEKQLGLGTR